MNKNILLIDDESNVIESYGSILRTEGYIVHSALSVEEALGILDLHEFAVVITDMRMPGQSGEDFLTITQTKHRRPIKVVLSAFVNEFFDDAFQSRYNIFAIVRKPLLDSVAFLEVIHKAVFEYQWRYENSDDNPVQYLNANQVLKRMGISRPTLYQYLRSGLPSKRIGGRRLFIWDEIRRWVDQRGRSFS